MAMNVGGIQFAINIDARGAVNSLNNLNQQLNNMQVNFNNTGRSGKKAQESWEKGAKAALGLATALGAIKLAKFAADSTKLAARVENLGTVLQNVGRIANVSSAELRLIEERTQSLGITSRQTRQALTQLAQANLDLRNSAQLARIAQNAAVIAGVNSSDAFERLIVSIQRNDVRLLRNLGIVINLNNVYREFSQQTGRTANSLTSFEKRQLLLNKVIERGALITGTYEAALQDVFKRFTSLDRLVEQAQVRFGDQFIPVFEVLVDTTSAWLKAVDSADSSVAKTTGTVTAFSAAFSGLTLVIGGAAAAFKLFRLALGPYTIAIGAASAAVAALGTAWFSSARAAREFTEAIENQRSSAEALSKELSQKRGAVIGLVALSNAQISAADKSVELKRRLAELITVFPDLSTQITKLVQQGRLSDLISLLDADIPAGQKTAADALDAATNRATESRKKLIDSIQQVLEAGRRGPSAGALAAGRIGGLGRTQGANDVILSKEDIAVVEQQLKGALEGTRDLEQAAKSVVEQVGNIAGKATTSALLEYVQAQAALTQEQANSSEQFVATYQNQLKQLETSSVGLQEIVRKAGEQQLKVLKDTGLKQLDELRQNISTVAPLLQNSVELIDKNLENVLKQRQNEIIKARRSNLERLRQSLDAANASGNFTDIRKANEELIKAQTDQENALRAVREEAEANAATQREALATANEAISVSRQAFQDLLARERGQIDGLEQQIKFIELRLDPAVATLTSRVAGLRSEFRIFQDQLGKKLNEELEAYFSNLNRLTAELNSAQRAATPEGQQRIAQLRGALQANRIVIQESQQLLLVQNKRFNTAIEKSTKDVFNRLMAASDKFAQDAAASVSKLLSIAGREALDAGTFETASEGLEKFRKGAEDLTEFFERFEIQQRQGGAAQIIFGIRSEVDKFEKLLEQVSSKEQLDRLKEIFPKAIEQRVDKAREALRKFKQERSDSTQDRNEAKQARFAELLENGLTVREATRQVDREAAKERQEAAKKEKELKTNVRDAEQAAFDAQKEFKTFAQETNDLLQARISFQEQAIQKIDQEIEKQRQLNEERLRGAFITSTSADPSLANRLLQAGALFRGTEAGNQAAGFARKELGLEKERVNKLRANQINSFSGLVGAGGTGAAPGQQGFDAQQAAAKLAANAGEAETLLPSIMKSVETVVEVMRLLGTEFGSLDQIGRNFGR